MTLQQNIMYIFVKLFQYFINIPYLKYEKNSFTNKLQDSR